MRVIFLDIDGVLNSYPYIWSRLPVKKSKLSPQDWADKIMPVAVQALNIILEETGAVVVVSSAWRVLHSTEELQELLELAGFTGKVIGRTPGLRCGRRGQEILKWMGKNGVEPEDAVILEDERFDLDLVCDCFVHVSNKTGLQESHIQEAIDLFGINKEGVKS